MFDIGVETCRFFRVTAYCLSSREFTYQHFSYEDQFVNFTFCSLHPDGLLCLMSCQNLIWIFDRWLSSNEPAWLCPAFYPWHFCGLPNGDSVQVPVHIFKSRLFNNGGISVWVCRYYWQHTHLRLLVIFFSSWVYYFGLRCSCTPFNANIIFRDNARRCHNPLIWLVQINWASRLLQCVGRKLLHLVLRLRFPFLGFHDTTRPTKRFHLRNNATGMTLCALFIPFLGQYL